MIGSYFLALAQTSRNYCVPLYDWGGALTLVASQSVEDSKRFIGLAHPRRRSGDTGSHIIVKGRAIGGAAVDAVGDDLPAPLHGAPFLASPRRDARHRLAAAGWQGRQADAGRLPADLTGGCREPLVERSAASQDRRQ